MGACVLFRRPGAIQIISQQAVCCCNQLMLKLNVCCMKLELAGSFPLSIFQFFSLFEQLVRGTDDVALLSTG